jgi:hypothetical protein
MLGNGTLIGTAGVSGLPDVEDHRLIVAALRTLLGKPARGCGAAPGRVTRGQFVASTFIMRLQQEDSP